MEESNSRIISNYSNTAELLRIEFSDITIEQITCQSGLNTIIFSIENEIIATIRTINDTTIVNMNLKYQIKGKKVLTVTQVNLINTSIHIGYSKKVIYDSN